MVGAAGAGGGISPLRILVQQHSMWQDRALLGSMSTQPSICLSGDNEGAKDQQGI